MKKRKILWINNICEHWLPSNVRFIVYFSNFLNLRPICLRRTDHNCTSMNFPHGLILQVFHDYFHSLECSHKRSLEIIYGLSSGNFLLEATSTTRKHDVFVMLTLTVINAISSSNDF